MSPLETQIDRDSSAPAHQQVRERILDMIRAGKLPVGFRLPSEIEIADRLGVSRMTANKSIQRLVSEGWLERSKGKGTFVARVPGTVEITRCTVLIDNDPEWSSLDYYFGALYGAIHRVFDALNVPMRIQRIDDQLEAKLSPLDGLGIVGINPDIKVARRLETVRQQGARVAILGAMWPGVNVPCFDSDNVLGAVQAVNHLADLGHRELLFVGGWASDANTRDRIRGFEVAMKSRRLPLTPESMLVATTEIVAGGEEEARLVRILKSKNRPSAIVAAGPRLTVQVIALARRLELEVPKQLSIVGFDDPDFFSLDYPQVTTVKQPLAEMSIAACQALMLSEAPQPTRTFDTELVVRGSTAPPSVPR